MESRPNEENINSNFCAENFSQQQNNMPPSENFYEPVTEKENSFVPPLQIVNNFYANNQNSFFENSQQAGLYFEKKAVKRTSNNIGIGLILFFVLGTAIQIVLSVVLSILGKEKIFENPAFLYAQNMLITLISFSLVAFFIKGKEKTKLEKLISFAKPLKGRFIATVMMGISFCYVANVAVSILQSNFSGILPFEQPKIESPKGILGIAISVLATAVFPAILEEFLFRGAIMGSLIKFGKPFAIFTSAFLFGLVHGNLIQIPFAFMVGLVLGFAVVETNSIWTGIFIHFINNLLAVILDYVGIYGGENLQTAVYMIVMASMIMLGFFGVYLLSLNNKELFKYPKTNHISGSATRFKWHCSSGAIVAYIVIVVIEVVFLQITA